MLNAIRKKIQNVKIWMMKPGMVLSTPQMVFQVLLSKQTGQQKTTVQLLSM
jgi:hypothetical protein